MPTPPCNRLAAGQRQREERGEVADSRGQVVALDLVDTPMEAASMTDLSVSAALQDGLRKRLVPMR
jgi:hypothetical protein